MTLCPVALTAGCKKCPIFSICPLKGVIGDQRPGKISPDKKNLDKKNPDKKNPGK